MDRRSLLKLGLGQVGLAVCGLGLSGCQSDPNAPQILGLKGAIPSQILKTFRQRSDRNSAAANLIYQSRSQIQELFAQLQDWKRQATGLMVPPKPWIPLPNFGAKPLSAQHLPDLVSLGDYWLSVAIVQGLIQPFDLKLVSNWNAVDDRWKQIVTRNDKGELESEALGKVWGIPYRWGATVIGYRRDLLAKQGLAAPKDWSDLLNPAFKGRISLLDSPRETIGLVLKYLGESYNSPNLGAIDNLESTLRQFHQQAKFYSSAAYLQPLILGDTWIAVGSSSELLPQLRTQPDLEVIVPQSGTAVWADIWARPQGIDRSSPTTNKPAYLEWLDFCLNRETSQQIARLSRAGSPLTQRTIVSGNSQENPLLNLSDAIWQKSETLQPLSLATVEQYRSLWQAVRQ